MEWAQLKPRKNDRAILIGRTGCGKTTLAEYLVRDTQKPYSVVYDAKNMVNWKSHVVITDFDELMESEERRIIYRPDFSEASDPQKQDDFFAWIYERLHTRLYVDEAYALLGQSNPAFFLQACLSRGREKGISTFIATQRPKRIPLITMSEAEHYYVFRLSLIEDRQRVYELTGIPEEEQIELRDYEFIYYNGVSGERTPKLKLQI